MFPKMNIESIMPLKLICIGIVLLLGLFLFVTFNKQKPTNDVADNKEQFVPHRSSQDGPQVGSQSKSKYNLFNEIKSFMARQTEYVMN